MFYDVHKENMFTTNLEDGRRLVFINSVNSYLQQKYKTIFNKK